ncbi:peptidoglycan recognition protein [Streptomyces xiaopingdaonensis]|uniref:peptidoglycan recognition protein family protein n=1 Tax=Streptomyces xiaopingdaonensis TaxID=1565415 RepID=UPI00030EEC48|nr:N-acetylmuramoyl-L-alanine amidase [Streptomyces xiaopingdaonensis]
MRAPLSSLSAVGAAALLLPLLPAATAAAVPDPGPQDAPRGKPAGATRSLPLSPDRGRGAERGASGLPARTVEPFSLVGVVWDDADEPLAGRVQVRTRAVDDGAWSGWRTLDVHPGASPDERAGERTTGQLPGATAPLWTGPADGVQVRVVPEGPSPRTGGGTAPARPGLPDGLRVELVDPGRSDEAEEGRTAEGRGPAEPRTDDTFLPALSSEQTQAEYPDGGGHAGPRPRITTRKGWGADERLREPDAAFTGATKAAFVHHTVTGNGYACSQVPSILRSIYRYHVKSLEWRDVGYNFFVDKCGNIYEGRAGGVAKPVMGAHTYGFNTDTTGVAVLGTYTSDRPSPEAVGALARLTAWKLGINGVHAGGTTTLVSEGEKYPQGEKVKFRTVSGHRDGYNTECPGAKLYAKLGDVRTAAAKLQRR